MSASQLPADLASFLRTTNGIDVWVSDGSPSGYFRLLPMQEIAVARAHIWGSASEDFFEDDDVPLAHWLAITEHQDGAYYVVLDPDREQYYFMDACGADLSCTAGTCLEELLDHLWDHWIDPIKAADDSSP